MQVDARGIFTGFVIAPAVATALAVLGMLAHLYVTAPEAAGLTVGEIAPFAGSLWFSGLMFAYPAAIAFIILWLVLKAIGLGAIASALSGALAGFGAMGAYLHRVHGGSIASALAGGQDISALTLQQLPGAFALPLIGAGAGLLAGLLFAMLARR